MNKKFNPTAIIVHVREIVPKNFTIFFFLALLIMVWAPEANLLPRIYPIEAQRIVRRHHYKRIISMVITDASFEGTVRRL
jgi:hypothetical protein